MTENQFYSNDLATKGFVFLGGQELQVTISNLSITGFLAELNPDSPLHNLKDVFQAINLSPIIDIYLPELKIAGEAEVVRTEQMNKHISFALEFRSISYAVDFMLYSRKAYRHSISAPGQIVIGDEILPFTTENVSVDGMMIRLAGSVEILPDTVTRYEIKRLELSGEIMVAWVQYDDDSTLMGMEYQYLAKNNVKNLRRFAR